MTYTKQVSFYTIGNVTTLFTQWLIIMIIPKITNFAEAGLFAVAISVSSIMNQIATFTLNQYQVADGYCNFSENDYALTRLVTIGFSFLCIVPIVFLFKYNIEQTSIIIAYTIYRNLINYAYLHMSGLQILGRLDYAGKCMIIEGIMSFILFIGSYIFTENILLSTTLMALGGGGLFLLLMSKGFKLVSGHRYGLKFNNWKNVNKLLLIGSSLALAMTAPIIITALPKLLLDNYWGNEIVGYFSTLTAPTIIVPTLTSSIFAPFIIYFSKISHMGDMHKLRIQYGKILLLLTIAAIICYILSTLLSEFIFGTIYGSEILPYTYCFDVLIVGIFLYSVGTCGITILITKNQGRAAGIASLCALAVSIIIFTLWIPNGGIDGATYGLLAAYGVFGLFVSLCVMLLPITNKAK